MTTNATTQNTSALSPHPAKENFDQTPHRDKNVGVCGDWHGNTAWGMVAIEKLADSGVRTIFHVGDFGFWGDEQGRGYLRKINRELVKTNTFLYVTLGNHEDYDYIKKVFKPVNGDHGFLAHDYYQNVIVLGRGYRWNWNDYRWISVGGANSIDRYQREETMKKRGYSKSWWEQESITDEDVQNATAGGRADMMIAHDVPYGVEMFGSHRDARNGWEKQDLDYAVLSRLQLRKITDVVQPLRYVHGHYHMARNHSFRFSSAGAYDVANNSEPHTPANEIIHEEYTTNYICMDKEYTNNNIGFIDLNTLEINRYSSFG